MADFFPGFEERRIAMSGADNVTGQPIASGHFLPEEAPSDTYRTLRAFFT